MKCLQISLALFGFISARSCAASPANIAASTVDGLSNATLSLLDLESDESRDFSWRVAYDDTDLPATPVFMNAIELMAQYAEYNTETQRIHKRRGMVLPDFPQIEIAVLPPESDPSASIPVVPVIWGLYAMCADMLLKKQYKQSEMTIRWKQVEVGSIFFTLPLDDVEARQSTLDLSSVRSVPIVPLNTTTANTSLAAGTGFFSWTPIWKPRGQIIPPTDVFMMAMSVIKSVAEIPGDRKVPQAFFIRSLFIDANMEFFFFKRITPRTRPPFYQYAHVLEIGRRMSGWMLEQSKFAEFYCVVRINGVQIGQATLDKGRTPQPLPGLVGLVWNGNLAVE